MDTKETIKHHIESGKLSDAKLLIEELESLDKNDLELISMKSIIAIMEGRLQEAEHILLCGLQINANHFDILYNLAYLYEFQELRDLAIGYYAKALATLSDGTLRSHIKETIALLKNSRTYTPSMPAHVSDNSNLLVSIVLLAYNHLDYTRLCVESIYKYTSHINFELIVVNNGSSDGTKDYFDSLPNARPIHLEQNVGVVKGFNIGMEAARGKYTACVCNDFIFTTRWMDNLLACIESDEKIGFVSPGASHISNYQQIIGNYSNLEEMQQFAANYNHSDPSKWEERVRLLPCVLMVRTEILKRVGYYDPIYYYGEFADDDISFRIRRAGYKLIFAKDTFTFHFGSVTTNVDHVRNNSLSVSREIFQNKFGIDSWLDAGFNPKLIDIAITNNSNGTINILGINAKCGGNPLQLKNKLYGEGITDVHITNFTEDKKYLIDLRTVSDQAICGNIGNLSDYYSGQKFNYIFLEDGFEAYPDIHRLIDQLKILLHQSGQLIFKLNNASYYSNVIHLILGNTRSQNSNLSATYMNNDAVLAILSDKGFKVQQQIAYPSIPQTDIHWVSKLAELIPEQREQIEKRLTIQDYVFAVGLE